MSQSQSCPCGLDPEMSGDNWCQDGRVRFSAYQQQLQEQLEDNQQAAVFSLLSSIQVLLKKSVSLSMLLGLDSAEVVSCGIDNFILLICHFMIA